MSHLFIQATPKRKRKLDSVYYALNCVYRLTNTMQLGYSISGPHPMTDPNELVLNITFASDEDKQKFTQIGYYQELCEYLLKLCKKDGLRYIESA